MAIITAEVLSACGVSPENREGRAKAALEQKYRREFEITQVYPQKFGELYYEVQAYAVEEPLLRFTAAIDTEDGNISDNFVERRVCAAIARQVAENLDALPGYYDLFVHAIGPQPLTDDAEISIRDYAALDAYNRFRIELFVKPEQADAGALYNSLSALLHGLEYLTTDARMFVVDEDLMGAVQDYFERNDDLTFDFTQMTKNAPVVELPYEKGVLGITESEFAEKVGDAL